MKLVLLITTLAVLSASVHSAILTVDAIDNIFGAGHAVAPGPAGGGGGTLPPSFTISPSAGQILIFANVTGSTVFNTGFGPSNPDGNPFVGDRDAASFGGIAGIRTPTLFPLVGLFLDDSEPTDPAPSRLDFTAPGGTSFTTLAPGLEQIFFIGDGLTGDGTGATQQFSVPATATRLFLGFFDIGAAGGVPGAFDDNSGFLTATFTIVPEPSSATLGLLGVTLLSLFRRQRSA